MQQRVQDYFTTLGQLPLRSIVTDGDGREIDMAGFFTEFGRLLDGYRHGGKLMLVGNGGSATIASHIAQDLCKNVGIPALSFNDPALLTALSNDEGYEVVFARQIGFHAQAGDLLIAISSSGNSDSIIGAVTAARAAGCRVLTMSGFSPDNRLRRAGDFNIYVPSGEYGFVEIGHLAFCHAIVDLAMGWTREEGLWSPGEGGGEDLKAGAAR